MPSRRSSAFQTFRRATKRVEEAIQNHLGNSYTLDARTHDRNDFKIVIYRDQMIQTEWLVPKMNWDSIADEQIREWIGSATETLLSIIDARNKRVEEIRKKLEDMRRLPDTSPTESVNHEAWGLF